MVQQHGEGPACENVAEVADCQIDSEEFMVEGEVVHLSLCQLAGPELQGVPPSIRLLLQDGSDTMVAGVRAEADWHFVDWECQHGSHLQGGGLGSGEGLIAVLGPVEAVLGGCHVCQRLCHVRQAWDKCSVVVDECNEPRQGGLVSGGVKSIILVLLRSIEVMPSLSMWCPRKLMVVWKSFDFRGL